MRKTRLWKSDACASDSFRRQIWLGHSPSLTSRVPNPQDINKAHKAMSPLHLLSSLLYVLCSFYLQAFSHMLFPLPGRLSPSRLSLDVSAFRKPALTPWDGGGGGEVSSWWVPMATTTHCKGRTYHIVFLVFAFGFYSPNSHQWGCFILTKHLGSFVIFRILWWDHLSY